MKISQESVDDWLEAARSELKTFNKATYREDRWVRWHSEMRSTLRNVFGESSHELKGYDAVSSWGRPFGGYSDEEIDAKAEKKFDEILSSIRGWPDALLTQIQRFGLPVSRVVDGRGIPKRYALTSPVYLTERLFEWSRIQSLWDWVWRHKVWSVPLTCLSAFASVVAILTGLGVL